MSTYLENRKGFRTLKMISYWRLQINHFIPTGLVSISLPILVNTIDINELVLKLAI
jgi:hypothetical protein